MKRHNLVFVYIYWQPLHFSHLKGSAFCLCCNICPAYSMLSMRPSWLGYSSSFECTGERAHNDREHHLFLWGHIDLGLSLALSLDLLNLGKLFSFSSGSSWNPVFLFDVYSVSSTKVLSEFTFVQLYRSSGRRW